MKNKTFPSTSIIIPNWNGGEKIMRCIESITKLDYPSYEIIVIDNCSSDGSKEKIKKKFKKIKIIENKENVGPAKALNQGFKIAKYDLILGLDNDVILEKNLLKHFVKVLASDPRIGMVAPKIYYYHKPTFFNAVGFTINLFTGKTKVLGIDEEDIGQFDKKEEREFIQGAVFLTKKQVIDKVGGMDESYFVYYSDADWSLEVRKKGYKIMYVPSAKTWHDGNTKQGGFTSFRIFHFIRSKLLFMRKHSKNKLFFYSFFFLFYTPKKLFSFISNKNFNLIIPYFKGIKEGLLLKLKN